MSFLKTVLLGAIAGLTIFIGLPVAKIKTPGRVWQALLNSLATGILIFLMWDIISKADEPIEAALLNAQKGNFWYFLFSMGTFFCWFWGGFAGVSGF